MNQQICDPNLPSIKAGVPDPISWKCYALGLLMAPSSPGEARMVESGKKKLRVASPDDQASLLATSLIGPQALMQTGLGTFFCL